VSVQFGRWNFDGKPVDRDYLKKVKLAMAPYGPDGASSYCKNNISILYHALHTTKESRGEKQPHLTASGTVITWDGRLDNRAELIRELGDILTIDPTDVSIIAAAYEKWSTDCFAKLIGDWALSVWDANTCSLILAKDPIGTRHLYYSFDEGQITWSTILDPLVLFAGKTFSLCEEYIAGWFSCFPATHLTPYAGIHSVPPSSSVLMRAGKQTVRKYWDFDPGNQIRYHTDAEYEEHFRTVFAEAVQRRLRSDSPILAELSGGMDSCSIVCMADTVIARGLAETPRLDTVSYYSDSEPNWDERPYFTKVEEMRGARGCHIDVSKHESFTLDFEDCRVSVTPGSGGRRPSEVGRQFADCMISQGNRVVLSGIGGDEIMGGVPTPTPELENLLASARFRMLAHQLKVWALNKRKPWFQLLLEAAWGFFPPGLFGVPPYKRPVPWLNPDFVKRNWTALQGYESRLELLGPLPSFQENISTLNLLRRQLACSSLSVEPHYEKRYPYLDRSLLEFIYAIPREQLVRPGQRRSLMRRSLVGIVPAAILERKRKAFVSRSPSLALMAPSSDILQIQREMVTEALRIVEASKLMLALRDIRLGKSSHVLGLRRTLSLENWLRTLNRHGIISIHRNAHALPATVPLSEPP
jgi:asparagine synthase (glutamine-hydrolysing)